MAAIPETMLQLQNVRKGNKLEFGANSIPTPKITEATDVLVRMDCGPLNPSDAPMVAIVKRAAGETPLECKDGKLIATLPDDFSQFPDGFVGTCGTEGTGVVVAAGSDPAAQALMGKRVACRNVACYSEFAKFELTRCIEIPEALGLTPDLCASTYVNPMTVKGMLDTMTNEGHKALVHTAAGSQLGRMLLKQCKSLGVPLVNVVRSDKAVADLKELGAEHVCNSSLDSFKADLVKCCAATGATLCFDAVGAGTLASDILMAMEKAILMDPNGPKVGASWYGSPVLKTCYRYGVLGDEPQVNLPGLGMSWRIGGWLLPYHWMRREKTNPGIMNEAYKEVINNLGHIYSTTYSKRLTLADLTSSQEIYLSALSFGTNDKFLICPNGTGF